MPFDFIILAQQDRVRNKQLPPCPSRVKFVGGNLTILEGCHPGQLEILQQVFDLIILSGAKVQIHNNEHGIISLKSSSDNIDIVKILNIC